MFLCSMRSCRMGESLVANCMRLKQLPLAAHLLPNYGSLDVTPLSAVLYYNMGVVKRDRGEEGVH